MAKKNKHARVGYNVTDPLDAIHLGIGKRIRMESDPEENSNGDKQVGRRSYNDSRYIQNVIDITYSGLSTLVLGNNLKKGQGYRITDFATKHRIHNTSEIFTADAEPIVVVAQTANAFERSAYSPSNPNDIIHYDFNNNLCEDGTTPRNGRITYRWDTANNVSAYYDWREVRFRRWLVTSKQQESMTTLTSSTLDCLLTFSIGGANLSLTHFNTNRRIHVQVGAIAHNAGELTLTIRKGTGSITKPLLKHNGAAWTANELANTSGIITNCLVRDAFIFMNYRSFGLDVVGQQVSPVSTTWNIGDGLSYLVDSNSFVDRRTFSSTAENISLEDQSAVNTGNNILFIGSARNSRIDHGSYNMTFQAVCWGSKIGSESFNNMFSQDFVWTTLEREVQSSFFGRLHNSTLHDHVISSTIYGPLYCIWSKSQIGTTTIAASGNMTSFMTPFIENSGIFLGGSSETTGRATALFTGAIINSLVGWLDPTNLIFQRTLKTTSFFERGTADLILEEQSYIGGTTPGDKAAKISDINGSALAGDGLGVDGEGRIILGDGESVYFTPKSGTPGLLDANLSIDGSASFTYQDALFYSEIFHGKEEGVNPEVRQWVGGYYNDFQYQSYLINRTRAIDANATLFTNGANGNHGAYLDIESVESDSEINLFVFGLGGTRGIFMDITGLNGIQVQDSITEIGLTYASDYSANFTARSLVDKAYVDAAIVAGDPYADYLNFNPETSFQIGFDNDFFQFLMGEYSLIAGGSSIFQIDTSRMLLGFGGDSAYYLGEDSFNFVLNGAVALMTLDPDVIEMVNTQGSIRLDLDGWKLGLPSGKGLEVSMQTSEGQEVVALEPIDGMNTDAILVSKPVHEGTASAANKLLKRSEVEAEIQTEVPARSSQFSSGPIAELETLYLNSTQFTITFEKHRIYGSRNLPIYALLNIVFTDAKPTIKTIVTHSGPWSPSIFADVYATSSGNYSSTSAMLADQASQTVNLIYRVGTTYWKYRGTTTGILETDYKQIRIVYKGSAYLTGIDHVNVLTFEYKDTHLEGLEVITDCVVIENIAITNGNLDPAKPDLDNIIRLGFNDNLNNTSWWSSHINLEITDDVSSDFIDLGGGDFSFRTCTNNANSTGGVIIATISDQLREAMTNASRITVLLRVRRVSPASATTVFHFAIMSPDASLGLRTEFDITNSRLGTRIKGGNYRSASSSLVFQQAEWIEVAFHYDPTLGSNHMKFFARAAGYTPPIPMSLIGQVNVTQPRPFFEPGVTNIYFNVEASGIGRRNNVEYDWCEVILNKSMALADIEARFDANAAI